MKRTIKVKGTEIILFEQREEDYISLTDIAKSKGDRSEIVIQNWMRNRNTLEFLGIWEKLNNSNFKHIGFDVFKKEVGLHSFIMNPKKWIEGVNAIGIVSKSGRYGGTYAHKDIAFEFASWISPQFKLYLIREYQRLKDIEGNQYNLEWNVNRVLASVNYKHHTDAIKDYIIPKSNYFKNKEWFLYAEEADLLNVALWGYTKKEWSEANPKLAKEGKNPRDYASINELIVMSRLETLNHEMIKKGLQKKDRFDYLKEISKDMLEKLNKQDFIKSVKKLKNTTYTDIKKLK